MFVARIDKLRRNPMGIGVFGRVESGMVEKTGRRVPVWVVGEKRRVQAMHDHCVSIGLHLSIVINKKTYVHDGNDN